MVYSIRTNRPMITNKPLKTKRKRGRLEEIKKFLEKENKNKKNIILLRKFLTYI